MKKICSAPEILDKVKLQERIFQGDFLLALRFVYISFPFSQC